MSRKNKGSRTVVHATVSNRSAAPKLSAEAAETLTQEVAKKDAVNHAMDVWARAALKRDYADKSAYNRDVPIPRPRPAVERPAKYLAPPDLPPLDTPYLGDQDIRVVLMGIFSFATFVAGMVIGKVL